MATREQIDNALRFAEDPDEWLRKAEESFNERIDIMEAVLAGKMGPENMSEADLVVMELRVMQGKMRIFRETKEWCVLDESASAYYH